MGDTGAVQVVEKRESGRIWHILTAPGSSQCAAGGWWRPLGCNPSWVRGGFAPSPCHHHQPSASGKEGFVGDNPEPPGQARGLVCISYCGNKAPEVGFSSGVGIRQFKSGLK